MCRCSLDMHTITSLVFVVVARFGTFNSATLQLELLFCDVLHWYLVFNVRVQDCIQSIGGVIIYCKLVYVCFEDVRHNMISMVICIRMGKRNATRMRMKSFSLREYPSPVCFKRVVFGLYLLMRQPLALGFNAILHGTLSH